MRPVSPWPALWLVRRDLLCLLAGGWGILAVRRCRSIFGLYAGLVALKYIQFAVPAYEGYVLSEPFLLLANAAAVLEAWWREARETEPRGRRNRFLVLGALAAAGALLAGIGMWQGGPVRLFNQGRFQVHVALFVFMAGWWLVEGGAGRHFRLLTAHQGSRMLDAIQYPLASTLRARWAWFYAQQFSFLAVTLVLVALWIYGPGVPWGGGSSPSAGSGRGGAGGMSGRSGLRGGSGCGG